MSTTIRVAADHRTLRLLDAAVLFWVVLWVVIGAWTGVTLWRAADVGDTVASSGRSLVSVGEGLQSLSAVPLVGDRPAEIGTEVTETAGEISERGDEVKGQLRQLGVVLGIAVVGIPVTPVVGLYLPLRLRRGREVAGIRRHLQPRRRPALRPLPGRPRPGRAALRHGRHPRPVARRHGPGAHRRAGAGHRPRPRRRRARPARGTPPPTARP